MGLGLVRPSGPLFPHLAGLCGRVFLQQQHYIALHYMLDIFGGGFLHGVSLSGRVVWPVLQYITLHRRSSRRNKPHTYIRTLHYIACMHCITLQYTQYSTLHYTALHYITYSTVHYINIPPYVHTLHLHLLQNVFLLSLIPSVRPYIHTIHYITLHIITLHYITLQYSTLHYINIHTYIHTCMHADVNTHRQTLHYTTLHYITVQYITLH